MSLDYQTITAQFGATCRSCEGFIKAGEKVRWRKDVGVWHEDCAPPKNAEREVKDAARRRELGIDPPEFGSAPMLREKGE